MHALILAAALASTEPQLKLGRHGAVVTQVTVAGGQERYPTGETPARLEGAPAEYDETLVFGGLDNHARIQLAPLDGGVGVRFAMSASIRPVGRVAADTSSEAFVDGFLLLEVDTPEPINVELALSGSAGMQQGGEAGIDVRLDGVEVAVLRGGTKPPAKLPVRVPAGTHELWIDVRAKAESLGGVPSAASSSAAFTVKATLAAPGPPPPAEPEPRCASRPVRFAAPKRPGGDFVYVTHAWPSSGGFSAVQESNPVLLVRVDRRVAPSEIIRELTMTDGTSASWRRPRMTVLACFVEEGEGQTFTTVVMRAVVPPSRYEGYVQWLLRSADLREPIGPQRFLPANEATGSLDRVGGGAMTPNARWREGRIADERAVDNALGPQGRTREQVVAMLAHDREALELLSWAGIELPSSVAALEYHARKLAHRGGDAGHAANP